MATALVKGLVRDGRELVPPNDLFALIGGPAEPPELPTEVTRWIGAEAALCGYEETP